MSLKEINKKYSTHWPNFGPMWFRYASVLLGFYCWLDVFYRSLISYDSFLHRGLNYVFLLKVNGDWVQLFIWIIVICHMFFCFFMWFPSFVYMLVSHLVNNKD